MSRKHIRKFFSLLAAALLVFDVLLPHQPAAVHAADSNTATVKKSVSGTTFKKGKQFTLTNMPYNGENSIIREFDGKQLTISGVQNFDFTPDGKYVFTVGECRTGSTKHTLLTRCALPAKYGKNAKAKAQDAMVLEAFGHSDVLAITQDDLSKEVYNLWVACKPGADGFGLQIARLTYSVKKSGAGTIKKTVYIKGFEKTNVENGKAGYYPDKVKPDRVACAVDTGSNQIVFRVKLPSGYSVFYLSYNFKKINAKLDTVKNKGTYDISKNPKWQRARINCPLTPLCSYQSFDVLGKNIYVIGGNFGLGAQIYGINYKTYKDGNVKELRVDQKSKMAKIITIDPLITVGDADYDKNYLEVEGIKAVKNGSKIDYYMNFMCEGPSLSNTIGVYKITL